MAQGLECERCRTWEEEIYWKHFSSMHFFLFLPKDFHHHLVLPAKFAENMMAKLPDKVSLIGPCATMWDIELKKTNTVEFGGDGWKEFVKAYDLKDKTLLMFKYNQNSSFEVLIFDPESFCEKEKSYFVKQCRHRKAKHENGKKRTVTAALSMEVVEDEEDDNGDHNDSEFVIYKKSRNDGSEGPTSRRNSRTPRKVVLACAPRGRGRPERMLLPCESRTNLEAQSGKEPEENGVLNDVIEREPKEKEATKEQNHVLEKEQNTLGNGATVLVTTHSHKSTENKGKPKRQDLEENGAAKGQSHVLGREQDTSENGGNALRTAHSHKSTVNKVRLRNQVPATFLRKLALQSDTAEKKYSKEYKSNRRPVGEIEKENALKRALKGLTTEKSFISVMRPTAVYRRFYLTIPVEWMHKHLLFHNQQVVLRMGEKTWTAFFYPNGKKGGGLAGYGWRKFALDNYLEEFDVCLFELATQKHDPLIIMDVEIFRVIAETVPPSPISRSTSK